MVNLKALERSLAKIEEVGKDELAFEANGVNLVLATLLPEQEEIVDAYARVAYTHPLTEFNIPYDPPPPPEKTGDEDEEDDEEDEGDPLAIVRHRIWLDRLRQATMGFIIVEIDGQDLRGLEYIETGEIDENGNPVSVIKHEAIRDYVLRWTRPVLTQMFAAYSELMDRINLKASKLVQFDAADIDEELKRLKMRQIELERHKSLSNDPNMRTTAETALEAGARGNDLREAQMGVLADMSEEQTAAQEAPAPQSPQEPRRSVTERRASSIPQPAQEASPPLQQETPPPRDAQPPQNPNVVPPPYEGDSMFDPSDGDAALEAENRRQEILYRQQQERKRQQEAEGQQPRKPIIQGVAQKPVPPPAGAVSMGGAGELREALNTANMAQTVPPQTQTPVRQGVRKQGGKEVPIYKQPTTTLERRGPQPDPSEIQIDQGSASRNPRFKPARED